MRYLPFIFLFYLPSAFSVLVERDLLASGDGLLTFDTSTGLEWLDTSVLAGVTPINARNGWINGRVGAINSQYDDVIGDWSAATLDQLIDLFGRESGLYATFQRDTPIGRQYGAVFPDEFDRSGVHALIDLVLSEVNPTSYGQIYFGGNLYDPLPSSEIGYLTIGRTNNFNRDDRVVTNYGMTYGTTRATQIFGGYGAFLVRNRAELPEPSMLFLFLIGMLGVIGVEKIQRRSLK